MCGWSEVSSEDICEETFVGNRQSNGVWMPKCARKAMEGRQNLEHHFFTKKTVIFTHARSCGEEGREMTRDV